jgi:histidinol-phosphate aminotransferase
MPELRLDEILSPTLGELKSYVPDQGCYAVRLDANEAPDLLSDEAKRRLAAAVSSAAWERYPDATARALRRAIAERAGVSPEEVLAGVGSDEIITLLVTALARPRGKNPAAALLTTTPTFVMYRMSARARGASVMEVPLDFAWDLSQASMLRALEISPPNLILIASPNNPTGTLASRDRLEAVIEAASGALVVIDEAYVDYADQDHLDLYRRHENVALLRTLSKVGFAALRVGWLIARPALIAELDKVRLPYNLNSVSQTLATLALTELHAEIERTARAVVAERARLCAELDARQRIAVTPSQANFVWIRTERLAGEVHAGLAERGVLVRSFHQRGGRLQHQLRVTLGTPEQNDAFLHALSEVE